MNKDAIQLCVFIIFLLILREWLLKLCYTWNYYVTKTIYSEVLSLAFLGCPNPLCVLCDNPMQSHILLGAKVP